MFALYHATKTGKESIPEEELHENDKGCKSFWGPPIIYVTITQACTLAVLQNVASLHGNFWGDKNQEIREKFRPSPASEMEVRNSYYSKKEAKTRNKFLSSPANLKKNIMKVVKEWGLELTFSLKQEI